MLLDSTILEVAISLVFIYLLLSLICTAVSEFISRIFAMRSNNLFEGIQNLLDEPGSKDIAEKIYKHPLISGLVKEGKIGKGVNWLTKKTKYGYPSYIPPRMFVIALLDVVAPGETKKDLAKLRDAVEKNGIINDKIKTALLALIDTSSDKLEDVYKNIEDWFNGSMERVSGWYKRNIQTVILILALIIVLVANVDTIMLANHFAQDSALRDTVVASAERFSDSSIPTSNLSLNDTVHVIEQLRVMPLGWTGESCNPFNLSCGWDWLLRKIFGLLITVFALSLGAPFWFDLLNKFINLRGTGNPPKLGEPKPEESKREIPG